MRKKHKIKLVDALVAGNEVPIVKLSLNSTDYYALIDSGSAINIVKETVLEKESIPCTVGKHKLIGLTGATEQPLKQSLIQNLHLNNYQFRQTDLWFILPELSIPKAKLFSGDIVSVDFILGNDFLMAHKAVLDYKSRTLTFVE